MTKKDVCEMIDRRIKSALVEGYSNQWIKEDILSKVKNLKKVLDLEGINFEMVTDPNWQPTGEFSLHDISSSRARYTVFYIRHSVKRILDLDWIERNKPKFPLHSKSQVFGMIKLREKLTPDFAFPF
jgi:hypothetical protein